jgi:dTDP-4-dehydrorhamnose 3,5-epimerase-like enzyme
MKKTAINNIKLIHLPKIVDPRGNLTFIEMEKHISFKINRVYWIYDVPGGEIRGSHAFLRNRELIIALSGSFDLVLNNGSESKEYHLNRSYYGLYVPAMYWRTLSNFSTNSFALVLASDSYDPSEYVRDFEEFKRLKLIRY